MEVILITAKFVMSFWNALSHEYMNTML